MSTFIRIIISVIASIIVVVTLVKFGEASQVEQLEQYKKEVAIKRLGKWCNDQFVPGYWVFVERNDQSLHWKEITGTGKHMYSTPSIKHCVVEEAVN